MDSVRYNQWMLKKLTQSVINRATGRIVANPAPPEDTTFVPAPSFAEASELASSGYGNLVARGAPNGVWSQTDMPDYTAPMLTSVSVAAQSVQERPLKVLDFGGRTGFFRSYVNSVLGLKTEWRVVETEEQVQHNLDLNRDGLEFSTEIGSDTYDIAIFAGSLQYVDGWRDVLNQTKASYWHFSRTPFGQTEHFFVQTIIDDGHTFKVPGRIICWDDFMAAMSGAEMFASWTGSSHLHSMGIFQSPTMLWKSKTL